jgi:hypothetical protein
MTRTASTLLISFAVSAATTTAATPVQEQEAEPSTLVSSLTDQNASASESAFMSLRGTLRSASPVAVKTTQASLCRQLAASTDGPSMRRICLVLAIAPCDDAVRVVVDRLQADTPREMKTAACQSLSHLVSRRQPADPRLTELALLRLAGIARDRNLPPPLLNDAIMAMGGFGPAGFDTLMDLHSGPAASKRMNDVFYTALSNTGDVRSLPVLRDAISDRQIREGLRIQAANAIGRVFHIAARRGETIDAAERASCWKALYQYLADDTPDQFFSVALKSLAEIAPLLEDRGILQVINGALASSSDIRREAALDALYRVGLPPDKVTVDLVQACVQNSASEAVQHAASAVLEQNQADNDSFLLQSP